MSKTVLDVTPKIAGASKMQLSQSSDDDAIRDWAELVAPKSLIERKLEIGVQAKVLDGIEDDPEAYCQQAVEAARERLKKQAPKSAKHAVPGLTNRQRFCIEAIRGNGFDVGLAADMDELHELKGLVLKGLTEAEVLAWNGSTAAVDAPKSRKRARIVCMADVAPQAITWLWPGRIPEAKIALLIGDPGMGKTMLALDIAARVSRGGTFPDGSRAPSGNVVFLTAEDGLADTIRPRLDAAGADVSRVWVVQSITTEDDTGGKLFSLADDVSALEEVVSAKHARLVVIDPLDGYLRGVDSHRNSEVRGMLAPFATMLERTGATGLCVHHLNKDASSVNAMYRAGGSLAFVAAARAVFGVAPDPDDEDRKLFLPVKLNIAAKPPGIGYRVTDHGIEWDGDPVTCTAAAAFGGTKRADSDLVAAAKDFLREALGDGQPVAQLLIEEGATERGISVKSLQVAKKSIGVQSKREGFGPGGLWYWQLESGAPNRE
jgi:putative DNA primase/helicase